MRTVAEVIRWRANQHPDRVALAYGSRETSYRSLDRAASRVANALIAAGVRPGDRVCVLDKGHDCFFETIFGIAKAGGVFTPINWRLAPPEIAYVINDARAPVVLVGSDFAEQLGTAEKDLAAVRSIVRFGDGPAAWREYESWRDAGAETDPYRDTPEEETAWQLYTSGTTGHPKGAEITHGNLFAMMLAGTVGFGGLTAGEVGLVCMPLYHIAGAGYAMALLFSGMTLVLTRDFDPLEILRLIEEKRINHAFFVPVMMNFLLLMPECATTDFSSLHTVLYGASPIPEDLLHTAMKRFDCSFIQAYGLTETTGSACLLSGDDHVAGGKRLHSCGRPVFGCRIRVVDAEGNDCPPGEVGEIVMRSGTVMKGYWNLPDATANAVRDGWFHTGDAGYLDEDGYLFIHDRVKDMIVTGGENVYPAEVESALFSHPAIADVAVIGAPDERWGESVKAVVVLAPGASATAQEIIEYCRGKIAGYKIPKSVDFVDALPRNPTGKILKRVLRDRYWEGRERRVN